MLHPTFLFFLLIATLAGTIFLLALIELLFTRQRRKVNKQLQEQLHAIKVSYNESINKIVLEADAKSEDSGKDSSQALLAKQKEAAAKLEITYKEELEKAAHSQDQALAKAKARAKQLEAEAKQRADEYLASRQKEVEADLMDLVLHVTKKVLPETLTYDIHKELVLQALREVQLAKAKE